MYSVLPLESDQPHSIDTTYGIAFIGLLAGTILYGITLLQTFLYFRHHERDSWIIKATVIILWVLDTSHVVLCTIAMYWYLITNYSNHDALTKTTWSMNLQTDCNGLIGIIVQCFFARRVWIMSRNWFLVFIIVILSLVHFGLGIVFTIEAFLLVKIEQFPKLIWVTSVGLGSAAACDIIIAVSLCFYLTRSRTGFKRTDSLITTLIAYSLTTGLVTSVIASIAVITFAIMPTNFIWMAFFWVLGKCYVNSFLAALNSRDSLRERAHPEDGTFLQLSPFQATVASQHPEGMCMTTAAKGRPPLTVKVETTTVSKMDYLESPSSGTSTNRLLVPASFGPGITPGPYNLLTDDVAPSVGATS